MLIWVAHDVLCTTLHIPPLPSGVVSVTAGLVLAPLSLQALVAHQTASQLMRILSPTPSRPQPPPPYQPEHLLSWIHDYFKQKAESKEQLMVLM